MKQLQALQMCIECNEAHISDRKEEISIQQTVDEGECDDAAIEGGSKEWISGSIISMSTATYVRRL